eukprot:1203228-Amphidinium_carterae.1
MELPCCGFTAVPLICVHSHVQNARWGSSDPLDELSKCRQSNSQWKAPIDPIRMGRCSQT